MRHMRWIRTILAVGATLAAGCADKDANSESHFIDDTTIDLMVVTSAELCPEDKPFVFVAGDVLLCSEDEPVTQEEANAALVKAGKATLEEAPTLLCQHTCNPLKSECVQGAAGCWEPAPDACCTTDADCASGVCVRTAGESGQCAAAPTPGACWPGVTECGAGWTCQGGVVCGCGETCALATGQCLPDPANGCCLDDAACVGDAICAPTGDGKGVCVPTLGAGECWTANDCELGQACEGAGYGVCESDSAKPQVGTCSGGNPAFCCATDADCLGDLICVLLKDGGGVCDSPPLAGKCWDDADCGQGLTCSDPFICPCTADCAPSEQGTCTLEGAGCCTTDADCADAMICVATPTGGACKVPATDGACWTDLDCGAGQACGGAAPCPCDVLCFADITGTCAPTELPGTCCNTAADCADGLACVELGGEYKACKPPAEAGKCWNASDCSADETCTGAAPCPCDVVCAQDSPGTCQKKPDLKPGCCNTSADCDGDLFCTDIGFEEKACKWQVPDGQCWNDSECGPGEACTGGGPCPCGVVCGQDSPGTCTPLAEGCCTTDADCSGGAVCVADVGGGKASCEAAPKSGECWADSDCFEGQTCMDAQTCPCDLDCDNVEPGTCVPGLTCVMTLESSIDGVSIQFLGSTCFWTQAQAAAGISVPYEVTIDTNVPGVVALPQDAGACGQKGPSGLIVFERLQGNEQSYCLCDTGLCMGPDMTPQTLVPGFWNHEFEWDGVNWFGPSDFGNPKGPPFPPGDYELTVSAKGTKDGVDFEVKAIWPVHITE